MSHSFQYIDIILLAMIAGFIFLRLRGILGKKTGFESKFSQQFKKDFTKNIVKINTKTNIFDENAQQEFLKGAQIAYETIITDFSDSDNQLTNSKPLLGDKIYNQFKEALLERETRGQFAEITFIGINSALIKEHNKIKDNLEVTVDFISEIITCVRDKDKKIISGDSKKIKKVYDTWVFAKDARSESPNWLLINTIT